jgi:high-affinity iron transporter
MGATFVVTLREAFEASLILGIVYSYLDRMGGRRYYGYVTLGAAVGFLASLALGVTVTLLSGPLVDLGPDLIGLAVIFGAASLLTWHGWWMRQHAREIKGDVQRRLEAALTARRLWVVALIAFTGVFREGAETVLFLWGLMSQATNAGTWSNVLVGVAGIALAAGLGWAIFRGGRHVSLPRFFAITSVVLLLVAAGLFSTGVGRLQGIGWLPMSEPLWDTSHILNDHGFLGSLFGGLVGYRARPSAPEVVAYLAFVALAGLFVVGPGLARPRRALALAGKRSREQP